MRTFHHITIAVIIGTIVFSACTSQRYAASETDDIYYSASDRRSENNNEFNMVKEVRGEDFKATAPPSGYYNRNDEPEYANPNAEQAYGVQQEYYEVATDSYQPGTTVNNFYGATEYYEGDYYEDSYASRIRRFNSVNVGLGYGYYDPFFVDPYWNYGWSYWDPYPRSYWSVGYNSWTGWNVGYNWGWGGYYGYHPYAYYRPYYYGWYDPWRNPYYYGNGGWCGTYWNGYYGGGYYSDNHNYGNHGGSGQTRKSYNGKAPSALGGGFSENTNTSGGRASGSERTSAQSGPVVDKEVTTHGSTTRPNTPRASARGNVNNRTEAVAGNQYNPPTRDRYKNAKHDVHGNPVMPPRQGATSTNGSRPSATTRPNETSGTTGATTTTPRPNNNNPAPSGHTRPAQQNAPARAGKTSTRPSSGRRPSGTTNAPSNTNRPSDNHAPSNHTAPSNHSTPAQHSAPSMRPSAPSGGGGSHSSPSRPSAPSRSSGTRR